MAHLESRPKIDVQVCLVLNEDEISALDALVGYGTDQFLEAFYEKMGRAYLQPHEAGLRSLFEAIRKTLPPIISSTNTARKAFLE